MPGTPATVRADLGRGNKLIEKSAAFTLTRQHFLNGSVTISGATGAVAVTLPDPAVVKGLPMVVCNGSDQSVTITTTWGGGASKAAQVSQGNMISLFSDGENFYTTDAIA